MCPVGRDALSHRSRRLPSPLDDKVPRIFETFSLRRENALTASSRASKREPEVRRRPRAMVVTRRRTPRRSACNDRRSLCGPACNDRRESRATLCRAQRSPRFVAPADRNRRAALLGGRRYSAIRGPHPEQCREHTVTARTAVRARHAGSRSRHTGSSNTATSTATKRPCALRATARGPARRAHTAMKVSARSTHRWHRA
jgi:hypothetical protein